MLTPRLRAGICAYRLSVPSSTLIDVYFFVIQGIVQGGNRSKRRYLCSRAQRRRRRRLLPESVVGRPGQGQTPTRAATYLLTYFAETLSARVHWAPVAASRSICQHVR